MADKVPHGFGPWVRANGVMFSVLNLADVTLEVHSGGHGNITSGGIHGWGTTFGCQIVKGLNWITLHSWCA